jgi:hypothetical protein
LKIKRKAIPGWRETAGLFPFLMACGELVPNGDQVASCQQQEHRSVTDHRPCSHHRGFDFLANSLTGEIAANILFVLAAIVPPIVLPSPKTCDSLSGTVPGKTTE